MESALTKAYKIKIQNFEGPFDLLFHLIEKNQFNLFDIPINEITDQYMDYLFAMQEMDMEIASEFLVMAATLLHIKSRMLLPEKKVKQEEEELDPREELVLRLVQYKKFKEFASVLKQREAEWGKVFYKLPEAMVFDKEYSPLDLNPDELLRAYSAVLERNIKKTNRRASQITQLIQYEKVSLRSKMKEVIKNLLSRTFFVFTELFNLKSKSRLEIVTGFLAVLELAKLKKVKLDQNKPFDELIVSRLEDGPALTEPEEDEEISAVNEY